MSVEQSSELKRIQLTVKGIVQGVGFRPFVYSLARQHGLAGFVQNDSSGVIIEVQGTPSSLKNFSSDLVKKRPPLSVIDSVSETEITLGEGSDFLIVESHIEEGKSTSVPPDISICKDCLRELFDTNDRRYEYPFINCTNCGPRFTIIKDIPYDRPLTTMNSFQMCPECEKEYLDPYDRRYHAQPNACPECGPQIWFVQNDEQVSPELFVSQDDDVPVRQEAIFAVKNFLKDGKIIAIKGIGGFHLACDAGNDEAVQELRERKGRVNKPFAVMVPDLEAAHSIALINELEEKLLTGRERPIVLLEKKKKGADIPISEAVSPGNDFIGLFLPYSPLHYLLVQEFPLVMTSGNLSDEPIVRENEEARDILDRLADGFLLHDREIHVVCDDSVIRVFDQHEYPIRRSRGYAPMPVRLNKPGLSVLASGGELKSTFCLTRGSNAYLSQHIGDMENLETLRAFERNIEHYQKLFHLQPEVIAHDEHPDYLSSRWATQYAKKQGLPVIPVQHHHAHVVSLMAEHGILENQSMLGICFDGTGYGSDGAIWGGEFLLVEKGSFKRVGHLNYTSLPGGDAAIKRPYRTALAQLHAAGIEWSEELPCVAACPPEELKVLKQQLDKKIQTVPTSSMGRLFDAVASLIGIRQIVSYEAQAAIEMESLCHQCDSSLIEKFLKESEYRFQIISGEVLQVDPVSVLQSIVDDVLNGEDQAVMACRFHVALVRMMTEMVLQLKSSLKFDHVGLTGGVFQNVFLASLAVRLLREQGIEPLTHRLVPANDGGIALGQAVIALQSFNQ